MDNKTIKTCSVFGLCHYKISKSVPECNYEGYCDYQLPRDSRDKEVNDE